MIPYPFLFYPTVKPAGGKVGKQLLCNTLQFYNYHVTLYKFLQLCNILFLRVSGSILFFQIQFYSIGPEIFLRECQDLAILLI